MAWTSSEYRPAYLGRGRGRGVERSGVKSRQDKGHSRPGTNASAWTSQPKEEDGEEEDDHRSHVRGSKEAADEETEDRDQLDDIVSRLLQSYNVQAESEEATDSLCSLKQRMNEVVASGAASCLICYSAVKRTNPVWSCSRCHCVLHLQCIQQWAKDSTEAQQRSTHTKLFPGHAVTWTCPKCRLEYHLRDIPSKYLCHCGKKVDPPNDPWLLPHSCGEVCRKPFHCGHLCSLLCHPGPCPPCPKTVSVACFCQKGGVRVRRCSSQGWSCGRVCRKVLACGLHTCEEYCHEGSCPPCGESVEQDCVCGKESRQMQCGTELWHCSNPCGAPLPCCKHFCDKTCHMGSCGDCPKSGSRTCPCGKSAFPGLPCTEESPTCGDTCGKALPCGEHYCMQRCHTGDCEPCRQLCVKVCRCGKKEKSVLCSSEYLCDIRCTTLRQCGSHQCKRKCCDGNCPPCEQNCNKTLSCRKHKCAAPCHLGPCYPCSLTVDVKCACGKAKITVPCGCERQTDPPKCMEKCRIPPSCHHRERKPHRCHFGPCPPCRQMCLKALSCGHSCSSPCHSEPVVKQTHPRTQTSRRKGAQPVEEVTVQPCPPCTHPVPVICFGEHETSQMKCSEARGHSCGKHCGRVLRCGNHTCQKECHSVTNPPSLNEAGDNCDVCEEPCTQPRPSGCGHACPRPCHPGPCPDCAVQLKFHCHCELFTMVVKCSEWTMAGEDKRKELLTCSGNCPKLLSCGHSCPLTCHPGACADVCRRRVTLRCPCKRLKKEVRCCEVAMTKAPCDEECLRILAEMKEKQRQEDEARREEEERVKQEELVAQQLLQKGKKRKKRKWRTEEEEEEKRRWWSWIGGKTIFLAVVCVLVAVIIWLGYERL